MGRPREDQGAVVEKTGDEPATDIVVVT